MNIVQKLFAFFTRPASFAEPAPAAAIPARSRMKVTAEMVARVKAAGKVDQVRRDVKPPELPPNVRPKTDPNVLAMDNALAPLYSYANSAFCGLGFAGYPYLSELAQRSEYRSPTETTATEMTRKWIRIVSKGDGDHSEKIKQLTAAFERHKIRDLFRVTMEHDGFYGCGHIYIKIKGQDDPDTRQLPLVIDKRAITKGSLEGFKNIEPIWTSPYDYNSTDPAADDFFKPTSWFVMGKRTHASRMLTIVSREVPDLLKPAYNFGGLSMSQLMEPYVNAWLRTRDSISDLLHSFSTSGIMTDMSSILQEGGGDGTDIFNRMDLFNAMRDNRGLMALNKDTEEFFQFNTPLSGLDSLQAQSQEQMAAPCHTPLVKLLGITPTGLNASTDGEIKVYYDYIRAGQEANFSDPLNVVLQIMQLDLFGVIDDAIGYEWEPLEELDGKQLAEIRKSDADAAVAYIGAGVISAEEERERLAADPNSGYNSLDTSVLPEPPANPDDDALGGDLPDDEEK